MKYKYNACSIAQREVKYMYMVKVVTPLLNVGDKLENKSDAGHALSTPVVR